MRSIYVLPIVVLCSTSVSLVADLYQDLSSLTVELSALAQSIPKEKTPPFVGQHTLNGVEYKYIVYTLDTGKKIRVEVNDVTKLNNFSLAQKKFAELNIDAIVNAANEGCLGGGGIDGVIHNSIDNKLGAIRQPKYTFRDICENLPLLPGGDRCITGDAKLVPGLTLAKYVVQAVGPLGTANNKETLLESTYTESLRVVSQGPNALNALYDLKNNKKNVSNKAIYEYYGIAIPLDPTVRTIAFPSISTGIFGYPKEDAAHRAINSVYDFLTSQQTSVEEVRFFLFVPGNPDESKDHYNRYVKILNEKLGYPEGLGIN